jgi:hypothetical protein
MARDKTIRVMISSRCNDPIRFRGAWSTLSEVRSFLKQELEKETLFGSQLIEVWINEDAPPEEASTDSWDACLKQVDEADILLILYNGHAGWTGSDAQVGICHAELERAISTAPGKVRIIELAEKTVDTSAQHRRFKQYYDLLERFRGSVADSGETVCDEVIKAVRDAIPEMVKWGVREAKRGKYHLGEALKWSRLDFDSRKQAMEQVAWEAVEGSGECPKAVRLIGSQSVLFSIHAVPDSFSTAEARELVGRPFVRDYELVTDPPLSNRLTVGPVHLIAVHKNVTERQACSFIGHPDVMLVNAPFGLYLADRIQHVQVLFVSNCRDETSTRQGIQRCLRWLEESGEGAQLVEGSRRRKRILKTIQKEIQQAKTH